MSDKFDELMERLGALPADRDLTALEVHVQARIARRPSPWLGLFAPVRAATVVLALVAGVGIGGFTAASAAQPTRTSLFAATDALAPSTLLGDR